ncbi:MAG: DUF4190 domain-containing protein, partial [Mobilicoccus sp.]|nr:DUF4190 domain-containing protein [Mobilicoccus sp.]
IALVLVFTLPPLAVVVGIVALILGIIAMRRANRGTHGGRGMAIAGLVLGVLSAIGGLLISIFLGAIFSMLFQSGSECMELPTQAQQEACMERVINERFGIDN